MLPSCHKQTHGNNTYKLGLHEAMHVIRIQCPLATSKTELFFSFITAINRTLKNIDFITEFIRIYCNRLVHFHFITIIAAQIENEMNNKLGHYGHHHHNLFIGRP